MSMDICFAGSVVMCICVHVVRYCKQILYGKTVGTAIFIWAGINTGFLVKLQSVVAFISHSTICS